MSHHFRPVPTKPEQQEIPDVVPAPLLQLRDRQPAIIYLWVGNAEGWVDYDSYEVQRSNSLQFSGNPTINAPIDDEQAVGYDILADRNSWGGATTMYYRVRGFKGGDLSAWSNVVKVEANAAPKFPQVAAAVLRGYPGYNQLQISFDESIALVNNQFSITPGNEPLSINYHNAQGAWFAKEAIFQVGQAYTLNYAANVFRAADGDWNKAGTFPINNQLEPLPILTINQVTADNNNRVAVSISVGVGTTNYTLSYKRSTDATWTTLHTGTTTGGTFQFTGTTDTTYNIRLQGFAEFIGEAVPLVEQISSITIASPYQESPTMNLWFMPNAEGVPYNTMEINHPRLMPNEFSAGRVQMRILRADGSILADNLQDRWRTIPYSGAGGSALTSSFIQVSIPELLRRPNVRYAIKNLNTNSIGVTIQAGRSYSIPSIGAGQTAGITLDLHNTQQITIGIPVGANASGIQLGAVSVSAYTLPAIYNMRFRVELRHRASVGQSWSNWEYKDFCILNRQVYFDVEALQENLGNDKYVGFIVAGVGQGITVRVGFNSDSRPMNHYEDDFSLSATAFWRASSAYGSADTLRADLIDAFRRSATKGRTGLGKHRMDILHLPSRQVGTSIPDTAHGTVKGYYSRQEMQAGVQVETNGIISTGSYFYSSNLSNQGTFVKINTYDGVQQGRPIRFRRGEWDAGNNSSVANFYHARNVLHQHTDPAMQENFHIYQIEATLPDSVPFCSVEEIHQLGERIVCLMDISSRPASTQQSVINDWSLERTGAGDNLHGIYGDEFVSRQQVRSLGNNQYRIFFSRQKPLALESTKDFAPTKAIVWLDNLGAVDYGSVTTLFVDSDLRYADIQITPTRNLPPANSGNKARMVELVLPRTRSTPSNLLYDTATLWGVYYNEVTRDEQLILLDRL